MMVHRATQQDSGAPCDRCPPTSAAALPRERARALPWLPVVRAQGHWSTRPERAPCGRMHVQQPIERAFCAEDRRDLNMVGSENDQWIKGLISQYAAGLGRSGTAAAVCGELCFGSSSWDLGLPLTLQERAMIRTLSD
eukprot:95320-Chlamydomonas_euryale.AAC.5